jgi:hypothetical protein
MTTENPFRKFTFFPYREKQNSFYLPTSDYEKVVGGRKRYLIRNSVNYLLHKWEARMTTENPFRKFTFFPYREKQNSFYLPTSDYRRIVGGRKTYLIPISVNKLLHKWEARMRRKNPFWKFRFFPYRKSRIFFIVQLLAMKELSAGKKSK